MSLFESRQKPEAPSPNAYGSPIPQVVMLYSATNNAAMAPRFDLEASVQVIWQQSALAAIAVAPP
jgi:hypothetical protein